MVSRFRKENGQSAVEFALVVPIFLLLVLGIIDMGWVAYEFITFDYAYRQASWEMSISYNDDDEHWVSGSTATNAIKNAIMTVSPTIKSGNLSVTSAQYHLWTDPVDYYTPNLSGRTDTHTRKWRYADITAHISYQMRPITYVGKKMFGSALTLDKDLDKRRLVMTREDG